MTQLKSQQRIAQERSGRESTADVVSAVPPKTTVFSMPFRARRRARSISRNRGFPWVAAAFIVLLIAGAIFVPLLSPYAEAQGSLADRLIAPFGTSSTGHYFLLGSDQQGRDTFTRLFYGARVSLIVGVVGVLLAAVFGTILGLVSGTFGIVVDSLLMRVTDVALSIPGLLVAILLASILRPSIVTIFIVIGLLLWPSFARLIRAEVLALKTSDFVSLSRVAGSSTVTIMRRHLLPNVMPSVIVLATLQIGVAIIMEASISFLGVGLSPDKASWGSMVNEGRQLMTTSWWLTVIPGATILLTVLSFNTIGDWARVRFDPRLGDAR